MARLVYAALASLDGSVADEDGRFDWAEPDAEVHAFVNDLERSIGTYLYGRRMYEVMVWWETLDLADLPPHTAVHHAITPLLRGMGLPSWLADAGGFVLALLIVTFLHLVIGEMAPKSWAIAHPERSATLLALPMRGFIWLTRPLLTALNRAANRCLRKVGVTPVDELAAGQDPAALRHLVEHSATVGTLDERYHANLISALELESITIGEIASTDLQQGSVPADAGPKWIQDTARTTGHLRLLVRDGAAVLGVVHVRDSLTAPPSATARDLMRPVLTLSADTPVYEALRVMRDTRNHLVVVTDAGSPAGLLTLTDVLHRLLPTTSPQPN